jgi:hypothetical protein
MNCKGILSLFLHYLLFYVKHGNVFSMFLFGLFQPVALQDVFRADTDMYAMTADRASG